LGKTLDNEERGSFLGEENQRIFHQIETSPCEMLGGESAIKYGYGTNGGTNNTPRH